MACLFPQRFNNSSVLLPCTRCEVCRKRRVTEWVTKLFFEAKSCNNNVFFVTLTYNDENLPDKNKFVGGSLKKEHLQKFIKRIRRNFERIYGKPSPIRYFAVGEYGSKSQRAHYHILFFGLNPSLHNVDMLVKKSWHYADLSRDVVKLIGLENLKDDDNLTNSLVKSLRYTLKYVLKQRGDLSGQDEREPEFSSKSTQPSLGSYYLRDVVAPYFRKKFLYPVAGLSPFHRYLFSLLYKDVNVFNGLFIVHKDGGIDFHFRDDKAEKLIPMYRAYLFKMDKRMQEHLIKYAYPDLVSSLDDYLLSLDKDSSRRVLYGYSVWLKQFESDLLDSYDEYRNKSLDNDSSGYSAIQRAKFDLCKSDYLSDTFPTKVKM